MTDEVDDLLLHVLRVKGVATVVDLESASGLEAVGQRVEPLVQTGLVTRVGEGEQALFGLTEQGRAREAQFVEEAVPTALREPLGRVYERDFLPVNLEFKRLCADWQSQGEGFELLEQLLDVDERLQAFLSYAGGLVPRLGRYRQRLAAPLERLQDGDGDALAGPVGSSYHNVWFELHEDLIATLGRRRADEEA